VRRKRQRVRLRRRWTRGRGRSGLGLGHTSIEVKFFFVLCTIFYFLITDYCTETDSRLVRLEAQVAELTQGARDTGCLSDLDRSRTRWTGCLVHWWVS